MTTNNHPESADIDAFLDQFTPMDEIEMGPRPGHTNRDRTIEYFGTEFEWAINISSTTDAQDRVRDNDSFYHELFIPVVNQDAFLHVLAEKGLVAATEDAGRALLRDGSPHAIDTIELYRYPGIDDVLGVPSIAAAASRTLEGEHSQWGMVIDRLIDIREARRAIDFALAQPEHADLYEISRVHQDRVLGDVRLGSYDGRAAVEPGSVPDPGDVRYLDYINGQS